MRVAQPLVEAYSGARETDTLVTPAEINLAAPSILKNFKKEESLNQYDQLLVLISAEGLK